MHTESLNISLVQATNEAEQVFCVVIMYMSTFIFGTFFLSFACLSLGDLILSENICKRACTPC